jgi:CheY-like chemotaxis protein
VPRSTWAPGKRYRGRPAQLLQRSTASSSPLKHPTRPDNGQGTYRLKLTHYPDTLIHGQDARDRGRSCAHSRDTSDPGGSRPRGLKRRRRLPRRRYRAAAAPDAIVLDLMMPLMGRFRGVGSSTPRWANHGCPCHGPLSDPEGVRRGAMLPTGRQAVLPQNLPSSGPPAL